MAQRLKEEVQLRIGAAALHVFAGQGFEQAKLAAIARDAGVSTGNLYRYYGSKEALFLDVVPRDQAARFLRLLRARVRAIPAADRWAVQTARHNPEAQALLRFIVEQREVVLVLLAGAAESPLAHVRGLVERYFEDMANGLAQGLRGPGRRAPREVPRVVLRQVFVATLDMIVAILREAKDGAAIEQAFEAFWRYQLNGLQALLQD